MCERVDHCNVIHSVSETVSFKTLTKKILTVEKNCVTLTKCHGGTKPSNSQWVSHTVIMKQI